LVWRYDEITVLIFVAVTALSTCSKKGANSATPVITNMNAKDTIDKAKNNSTLTYLALGDSYTIGESVPADQSYPNLLASELTSQKYPVNSPKIIAITGWTTDELINAIASSDITDKKFDFVTLLIGVNDQYRQLSRDNYRTKFQQVLNTAIKFAGGNKNRVFVLSIPDWGVTPFAAGRDSIIGPQIDQFNAINKQISDVAGVNYLDITPISRKAANDPYLITSDGLHPSGKMYAMWVNSLGPLIATKLNLH
jgi:lysophospholipase L1-like esterase